MSALWLSLGQLALGLALTFLPFIVGCLLGARRLEEANARAEHFEEKYLDLLDLVQRNATQAQRPTPRTLREPQLRFARGGQ